MAASNFKIDVFMEKATKWRAEMEAIRNVLLDTELEERFRWRQPCYAHQGKNVCILGCTRAGAFLSFFRGALLDDPKSLLVAPGPNSQAARQLKVSDVNDVAAHEADIRGFVAQAVALVKGGARVDFAAKRELILCPELQTRLDEDEGFRTAFNALTLGRQRSHNLFVSGAKQATTQVRRVEKCLPKVMAGKGLNEW